MFESILLRKFNQFKSPVDAGLLAETLFFYKKTMIAADRSDLISLLRIIGPDDLLGLIRDKHISLTIFEDSLATRTHGIVPSHNFACIKLVGDQSNKKMNREKKLTKTIEFAINNKSQSRKIARELLDSSPYKSINSITSHPQGITGIATADLENDVYVYAAVKNILDIYAPNYSKSLNLEFRLIKTDNGFVSINNIDFSLANADLHKNITSLTEAFILNHLLDARGDMLLSAHYLSELVTTPAIHNLINIQFQHLLEKRTKNANEITLFQDNYLEGRSLREVINNGERSFSEFRHLLDKSQKFKNWLEDINPDAKLISEYQKASIANTWMESLPVKMFRFSIGTGIGALLDASIGEGIGVATGAIDTFLIDKIMRGWKPHHFVQGPLSKFINN